MFSCNLWFGASDFVFSSGECLHRVNNQAHNFFLILLICLQGDHRRLGKEKKAGQSRVQCFIACSHKLLITMRVILLSFNVNLSVGLKKVCKFLSGRWDF